MAYGTQHIYSQSIYGMKTRQPGNVYWKLGKIRVFQFTDSTSPKILTFSKSFEDECTYIMFVADVSISLIFNKGPTTKCEHPFTQYTQRHSVVMTELMMRDP